MPTGALVVPPIMKDKLESTSLADYLDVNPLTPRKEKKKWAEGISFSAMPIANHIITRAVMLQLRRLWWTASCCCV